MRANYKSYSDAQLTELLILEDHRAFEEIYCRYFPPMYSFSFRLLKDDALAQDVTQDLFTKLFEKMDQVEINSIRSYLYKGVRHLVIDQIRKQHTRIDYISAFKDIYSKGDFNTENEIILKDLHRQIEREVERLPKRMQDLFRLSREKYLSNKEIAEMEGVSEQTVRNTISKAIAKLRLRIPCIFWLYVMAAILWLNKNI